MSIEMLTLSNDDNIIFKGQISKQSMGSEAIIMEKRYDCCIRLVWSSFKRLRDLNVIVRDNVMTLQENWDLDKNYVLTATFEGTFGI